jgi:hypothetical protein
MPSGVRWEGETAISGIVRGQRDACREGSQGRPAQGAPGPWVRLSVRGKRRPGRERSSRPGQDQQVIAGPTCRPEDQNIHRRSCGSLDSATALLFRAASTALRLARLAAASGTGRCLLGRARLFAASARGAPACHQAGAREESGNAEPCQELLEFLRVHVTPPFPLGDQLLRKTMEIRPNNRKILTGLPPVVKGAAAARWLLFLYACRPSERYNDP